MDVDKRLVVRNSDIYGMTITNRRYSSNASLSVNVAVDQGATAAQLRALHEAVKAHVQALPLEWRPGVSMVVGATDAAGQPPNRVTVSFWLTHHASWQEPGKISLAQTELTIAVLEVSDDSALRLCWHHLSYGVCCAARSVSRAALCRTAGAVGGQRAANPALGIPAARPF